MSHDASATWSGFNYQGKVAIHHTLNLIKQKLQANVEYDFNGLELILENHEDFDIRGLNGFESFHQVKAINQTAFSTYENALFAMLLQLDNPNLTAVTGYLHTWKALKWNGAVTFEQKLKDIIKKVTDDYADSPDDSIISKAFTDEMVTEKKIKILRQARSEDARLIDRESINTILNQAYNSAVDSRVTNRIKLYNYNDILACDINNIDSKVKQEISEIHVIKNIASNDAALDKIFCALLAKLDANVILKHNSLNETDDTPIPFLDVIQILLDDDIRDSDEAYLASRFKVLFIRAFEEFLDDEELCAPDIAEAYSNGDSNLNVAMSYLLKLSANELLLHFKKFNPHVSLDTGNTTDNSILINMLDLKLYLFSIFRDICCTKITHQENKQLILYLNGKKRYLPTTIGNQSKKSLVIQIMQNSQAISSLFEVSAMLTGCLHANEIECFADEYSKILNVTIDDFYVDEPPENKEKITQISRDIRLIKTSTAAEEINNA
jgi:hypothetical protein